MRVPTLALTIAIACTGTIGAIGVGGCGGPQDVPPQPLSRHFDDMYIAAVPLEEKQAVIQTQNDWSVAKMEKAKADADWNEAGVMLDVAKNEREATKLDEKSAESRKKAADQSADQNRINEASKEIRGAELARRAADERVKYVEAYREWLKRLIRYTEHHMYWREAQYELAKAKVARSKNIQPKDFVFDDFGKQEADRSKKTAEARDKADRERSKASEARSKWLAIQGESDKLLGKRSQFPDPMAPRAVQGDDPTRGSGGFTVGTESKSSDQRVQPTEDPSRQPEPRSPDEAPSEGGQ